MRMIPSQPLGANSHAEIRTFDQLRAAFSRADRNGWFAMHSLNLPRHEYKRFGEIDFVVCGPDGLFVLEVKGGGVSCHEGVWETTNRFGETERLRESPFKQAEGALHGLREKLHASFSNIFVVGYGVVMPDVQRLPDSAEWDRAVLADGRDFRQFEKWLERFIRYWRAKDTRKAAASPSQLNQLQQQLRPDFEAVMPLHVSAHDVDTRIVRLTEDQLKLVDVVEVNPRVICSGGAGTGKTMLALELAKRWGASGMKTVLACHSPWLKRYLEGNAVPGLVVSLAESLQVAARRAGIEKFDALIVDEGQDILNMDALDRLDNCLSGGISEGRWCFFHDTNNQSGLCGSYVPDAYDYLESFCPVQIPLRTNCRNALPILQRIQGALDADVGNSGVGDGPAVREVHVADAGGAIRVLEKELRGLVDKEGFNPGDIVVLSPLPFAQSWTSSLPEDLQNSISVLDDASPRNVNRYTIGFAQIADFKGLESEVIVLVDMPEPGHSESLRSHHYVGMSRARALLSMICCV
ncbi:MAG: NERD domain-containing protein [Gammaproteobacteria bacterium]|nr:NERD domain-containing protein [Gammaproteobacteria bacterium]MDE0285572.1 NERD domain-containing protein [Gammaproteobacteria bacterium]